MNTRIIILILIAILAGFSASGKSDQAFRNLTNRLQQESNLQYSELGKKTIKLYIKEKNPSPEVSALLNNVEQLNILSFTGDKQFNIKWFCNQLFSSYPINDYSPIKVQQNEESCLMIYVRENAETISDLLVAEARNKEVSLVEIRGQLNLEKIALLKEALNINGLDPIDNLGTQTPSSPSFSVSEVEKILPYKPFSRPLTPKSLQAPTEEFRPWLLNNSFTYQALNKGKEIIVYDRYGNKILDNTHNPTLLINGYSPLNGYQSIRQISPECIQSVNVVKDAGFQGNKTQGLLEFNLKGMNNQLYTVCEGHLYFGQNGHLQVVDISSEHAPRLLVDCQEKPLCEIENIHPEQVKSIELSQNPVKCMGKSYGQFVVVESK